jgi:transcriptional regulator GlxA family with amidase domain
MKKVTIVAFDRFTDIDVFLPWDLFNRARLRDKTFQVKIVGTAPVHTSAAGIELKMQGTLEDCRDADVVFFASGSGTRALYKNPEYLQQFHLDTNRQIVCSMCSGALILAGLGLLDGLTATTYPTAVTALEEMGVEVLDDMHFVAHGNVATAAGCLAALDLVGWCLEKMYDADMKEAVLASVQPIGQGQVCIY